MSEKYIPIETEYGNIIGRDSFYLESVDWKCPEPTITLSGYINVHNCSNYNNENDYVEFSITFNNVLALRHVELDYWMRDNPTCFDEVIDSEWLKSIWDREKATHQGKIRPSHKHYTFSTYDDVFEIISTQYDLNFIVKGKTNYIEPNLASE